MLVMFKGKLETYDQSCYSSLMTFDCIHGILFLFEENDRQICVSPVCEKYQVLSTNTSERFYKQISSIVATQGLLRWQCIANRQLKTRIRPWESIVQYNTTLIPAVLHPPPLYLHTGRLSTIENDTFKASLFRKRGSAQPTLAWPPLHQLLR